ncbi:MAG: hypothetical protein E3K29_06840 [Candidatus Brocadia sp.]|nr:hypothetical protein [Candidatus Brocadia sp.]
MYRLKPNVPDFEVVDGPYAGRKYTSGQIYNEIPAEERHKFDPEFTPSLFPSEGEPLSPAGGGAGGGKKKKVEGNQ